MKEAVGGALPAIEPLANIKVIMAAIDPGQWGRPPACNAAYDVRVGEERWDAIGRYAPRAGFFGDEDRATI